MAEEGVASNERIDYEVPVAFCVHCNKNMPVYIKEFELDGPEFEELNGQIIEIVVCPQCFQVLSLEQDVEVKYYKVEDLEKVTDFKFNGTE